MPVKTKPDPVSELAKDIAALETKIGKGMIHLASTQPAVYHLPFMSPHMNYATEGGAPWNRVAALYGDESTGKSLCALELVAQAQNLPDSAEVMLWPRIQYHRQLGDFVVLPDGTEFHTATRLEAELEWIRENFPDGARCLWHDIEGQFDTKRAQAVGVDTDDLFMSELTVIEDFGYALPFGYKNYHLQVMDSTSAASSMLKLKQEPGQSAGYGVDARAWKDIMRGSMTYFGPAKNGSGIPNMLVMIHQMSTNVRTGAGQAMSTRFLRHTSSCSIRFTRGQFLWEKDGVLTDGKLTGADDASMAGMAEPDGLEVFVKIDKCVSGDTLVHVHGGVEKAEDLAGRDMMTLSEGGIYRLATWRYEGEHELYRVDLDNGDSILATRNHEWPTGIRNHGVRRRVKTLDLVGQSVPIQGISDFEYDEEEYAEGVRHGMCYGDGTLYQAKKMPEPKVRLSQFVEEDRKVVDLFFSELRADAGSHAITTPRELKHGATTLMEYRVSGLPARWKTLPHGDEHQSYMRGFMAGLLQADGRVTRDYSVCIYASNLDALYQIRRIGQIAGLAMGKIGQQTKKESWQYRSGAPGKSSNWIHKKPNWYLPIKNHCCYLSNGDVDERFVLKDSHRENLRACVARSASSHQIRSKRIMLHARVVSVTPTGRVEPVYCCEEPETNTWVTGSGVLTGNSRTCRPFRVGAMHFDYKTLRYPLVAELASSGLYYGIIVQKSSWFSLVDEEGEVRVLGQGLKVVYARLIEDEQLRTRIMCRLLSYEDE